VPIIYKQSLYKARPRKKTVNHEKHEKGMPLLNERFIKFRVFRAFRG